MALSTVLAAVNARLSGVETLFGAENLARHGSSPRVVWVPLTESFGPPDGRGSERGTLWTRNVYIEAHLWAGDYDSNGQESAAYANLDAMETLIAQVVRALHYEMTQRSYQLTGQARWKVDDELVVHGAGYVLPILIKIPIQREATTTADMDSMPVTRQIQKTDESWETDS